MHQHAGTATPTCGCADHYPLFGCLCRFVSPAPSPPQPPTPTHPPHSRRMRPRPSSGRRTATPPRPTPAMAARTSSTSQTCSSATGAAAAGWWAARRPSQVGRLAGLARRMPAAGWETNCRVTWPRAGGSLSGCLCMSPCTFAQPLLSRFSSSSRVACVLRRLPAL